MQFVMKPAEDGVAALAQAIQGFLSRQKRVLWLVSGGSNIPLSVDVMARLPEELTDGLVVMLIDERFGPVGHADSNSQQLLDAGFDAKWGQFIPVMDGSDEQTTVQRYAHNLETYLSKSDAAIAQFGMGSDGHVAGILPGSPAAASQESVVIYDGADGRRRITPTFPTLRRLTSSYLFAYGEGKRSQLEDLRDKQLPLAEQPAQILKELPDVYIYNDQIV